MMIYKSTPYKAVRAVETSVGLVMCRIVALCHGQILQISIYEPKSVYEFWIQFEQILHHWSIKPQPVHSLKCDLKNWGNENNIL